jgi:hypothetical protein
MTRPTNGVILQAGDPSKKEEYKNAVWDCVKEVLFELGGVLHKDYFINFRSKIAGGKLIVCYWQWGRNIHELAVDNDGERKLLSRMA